VTHFRTCALVGVLALVLGAQDLYTSAQAKLDAIESGRSARGSRIVLTPAELNAWVAREIVLERLDGVRNPRLDLGQGSATGYAIVDFARLQRSQGNPPGWLMQRLLSGERPVRVTARISSGRGTARVDVERVEISGMTIDGDALDFLIRNFLLAMYPNAAVGRPFDLAHGVERLEVRPSGVTVVMGR
jgi:hypothetical protein